MNNRAARVYDALCDWQSDNEGHDICDFLDHVVHSLTGIRLAPFFTQRAHLGEDSLVTTLSFALEKCYVSKEWLRPGDLVFWRQDDDSGLGIVLSSAHLATPSPHNSGLVWIAMDYAQYGWRLEPLEDRS